MVKEVTMYTVICDNCGKDSNGGSEISGWDNKDYAIDVAMDSDFIEHEDKHICDTCYYYDDDDNLVIVPKEGGNNG